LEDIEKIQYFYHLISNKFFPDDPTSFQKRVNIIKFLEETTKYEFKNTKDFHQKMKLYLSGYQLAGKDLKKIRKQSKLTQSELAKQFGISRPYVIMMEKNKKPLNQRALNFIKSNLKITT